MPYLVGRLARILPDIAGLFRRTDDIGGVVAMMEAAVWKVICETRMKHNLCGEYGVSSGAVMASEPSSVLHARFSAVDEFTLMDMANAVRDD